MEDRLHAAVARVREQLAATYEVVVDTSSWAWSDGRLHVSGAVLLPAQGRAYQEALSELVPEGHVPQPVILSQLDAPWREQSWVSVLGGAPLDLHRGPRANDLQTQWVPPAWLRSFGQADTRTLVQLPDGTLGWTDTDRLEADQPQQDPWKRIGRPRSGSARPPVSGSGQSGLLKTVQLARSRLGNPYLWGGNTDAAADCSGFVQSVVFAATGVLLPKHTGDQRRLGARVGVGSIDAGDIVFVRGREQSVGHVGIAVGSPDGVQVVHSCLSRGRVLEESLELFLTRYRFTGARRVVDWEAPAQ